MSAAVLACLLALQVPATPPAAQSAPPPEGVQQVVAWQSTLRAGRTELQQLSNAGEHERAIELAARIVAVPSSDAVHEDERAEALFDVGVALGNAAAFDDAAEAFHQARGIAGSRPLGADALYNAGTSRLQGAEALRLQIPEVREKLGLQPLAQQRAAPPGNAPSPHQEAPDALAVARQAYLAARADLVERLRCDASDRDTRANLELVQRRLRELEELEQQREEQQQDQQQQDQQQKDDPKKDEQQKDQQQDPKDQQKQDPQDQEQPKPDEQPPEPKDEEPKDEQQAEAQPQELQELQLSEEEVTRLLDQLQQIEQQAEQVRAALRERRRVPVKKDW